MKRAAPWLILLVLTVMPLAHTSAASSAAEAREYRDQLASLPELQNSDGGWGRPTPEPNGTLHATTPSPEAFLQTILTADLLLLEAYDPYASRPNWEGATTSLAASNVSNTLDWLRNHEATHGDELSSGQHALGAIAYAGLGDEGNADRILQALRLEAAADPGVVATQDLAQLLVAHGGAALAFNDTENETIALLDTELATRAPTSLDGTAWALLAQPAIERHATYLRDAHQEGRSATTTTQALMAWALATSGDISTADALLDDLSGRALSGLAQAYVLHGTRTAHPEYSPLAPDLPTTSDGVALPTRASGGSPTASEQAPATQSPVLEEGAAPRDGGTSFPLPAWLMAGILLVALSVVVVTGLAYGLKREDLQGSRREIFNYIESNPGAHFSRIRRDLGYAPGTFQHHLSVLESEGWITSHKESRYKRYFVNGNRYKKLIAGYTYKQRFAALANETTRSFVSYLKDHPGATQKQVAARLNIHASTVNWHAKRLQQAGILEPKRVGKEVQYHVDPGEVEKMLKVAGEAPAYASMPAT